MKNRLWGLAAVAVLLGASSVSAAESAPSLGKANAPVVIDEYASFACSHCSEFYVDTLPQLEKKYIDAGKVRVVFHDFPIDGTSLKAAAIVHCMPEGQRMAFVALLYKNQQQWAFGGKPEETLIQYAKLGGLGEDTAKACMANNNLLDSIIKARQEATDKYGVEATPTFVFNGGKAKIAGALPMKKFEETIDGLLAGK